MSRISIFIFPLIFNLEKFILHIVCNKKEGRTLCRIKIVAYIPSEVTKVACLCYGPHKVIVSPVHQACYTGDIS